MLRGQCFTNEQILRGPALAALSGPVKGQCRLVCRVNKRYRLDRAGIIFVSDLVRDVISPVTLRSNAFSAELKVAMTLRFLATGKMQQCNSDDLGPSQPSISRIVMETIMALTAPHIVTHFIDFPTTPRIIQQKETQFMQIASFPGVVGAIDGTHIKIIAPTVNENIYVNRKRYHSINTQVVFDAEYNILDVVPKWPGSTHDARILNQSGLKQLFERHFVPPGCHLIPDSNIMSAQIRPTSGTCGMISWPTCGVK